MIAVEVAEVTVPTAPLLKVIVVSRGVAEKPKPLITTDELLAPKLAELDVTTGVTRATCTAAPLATPLVVTMAVRLPAEGFVVSETVRRVEVALVTVPTAPLLNVTVLLAAVVSKPVPAIVKLAALAARLAVDAVMVGAIAATCIAAPLLIEFVVTTAVKLPAEGFVPKVTVNAVAVAEVTVPTPPLLRTTVLLAAIGSNAKPLITNVVALVESAAALRVTDGVIRAT